MSGIPSLTILSEEQKFNGDNLLQWKTNITQLLGSKGLLGYIDGKVQKPVQALTPESGYYYYCRYKHTNLFIHPHP